MGENYRYSNFIMHFIILIWIFVIFVASNDK